MTLVCARHKAYATTPVERINYSTTPAPCHHEFHNLPRLHGPRKEI